MNVIIIHGSVTCKICSTEVLIINSINSSNRVKGYDASNRYSYSPLFRFLNCACEEKVCTLPKNYSDSC